jgi:hypothetical protein
VGVLDAKAVRQLFEQHGPTVYRRARWPRAATTVHLAACRGVLLDGALSLDDAIGREVL